MYTTRILPPEEWTKLAGTECAPLIQGVNPAAVTVLVAEDGDQIVGCWALINFAHLEGMWVHPAHRRKGVVLMRLWNEVCDVAQSLGVQSVFTGADRDEIATWIEGRGGHKLPFESFVLPLQRVGKKEICH